MPTKSEIIEKLARDYARHNYRANWLETIVPRTEEQYVNDKWREYKQTPELMLEFMSEYVTFVEEGSEGEQHIGDVVIRGQITGNTHLVWRKNKPVITLQKE